MFTKRWYEKFYNFPNGTVAHHNFHYLTVINISYDTSVLKICFDFFKVKKTVGAIKKLKKNASSPSGEGWGALLGLTLFI